MDDIKKLIGEARARRTTQKNTVGAVSAGIPVLNVTKRSQIVTEEKATVARIDKMIKDLDMGNRMGGNLGFANTAKSFASEVEKWSETLTGDAKADAQATAGTLRAASKEKRTNKYQDAVMGDLKNLKKRLS